MKPYNVLVSLCVTSLHLECLFNSGKTWLSGPPIVYYNLSPAGCCRPFFKAFVVMPLFRGRELAYARR